MGRIFLAFAFVFLAFTAQADEAQPMRLPVDKEPLTFVTANGNKVNFALEVADTDDARTKMRFHSPKISFHPRFRRRMSWNFWPVRSSKPA